MKSITQNECKSHNEIWDNWTSKQRQHFIETHLGEFMDVVNTWSGKDAFLPEIITYMSKDLPYRVYNSLVSYVKSGQYATGGGVYSYDTQDGDFMEEGGSVSANQLNLVFSRRDIFEKAKDFYENESSFYPADVNDEFRTFVFDIEGGEADVTEFYMDEELQETDLDGYYFELADKYASGGGVDGDEEEEILKFNNGGTIYDKIKEVPNWKFTKGYGAIFNINGKKIGFLAYNNGDENKNNSIGEVLNISNLRKLSGVVDNSIILHIQAYFHDKATKMTKMELSGNDLYMLIVTNHEVNDFQIYKPTNK